MNGNNNGSHDPVLSSARSTGAGLTPSREIMNRGVSCWPNVLRRVLLWTKSSGSNSRIDGAKYREIPRLSLNTPLVTYASFSPSPGSITRIFFHFPVRNRNQKQIDMAKICRVTNTQAQ
jgi:hypothetical protein